MSYIQLGQNATTLSGGEAQRVKLARELAKRATGRTLYILDEPTTGLHFHDVAQLLVVLHRLRDEGNTVVVIEHNLDVVKTADWIIDLGPGGGAQGGYIVCAGTPKQVARCAESHTGQFLAPLLKKKSARPASLSLTVAARGGEVLPHFAVQAALAEITVREGADHAAPERHGVRIARVLDDFPATGEAVAVSGAPRCGPGRAADAARAMKNSAMR